MNNFITFVVLLIGVTACSENNSSSPLSLPQIQLEDSVKVSEKIIPNTHFKELVIDTLEVLQKLVHEKQKSH